MSERTACEHPFTAAAAVAAEGGDAAVLVNAGLVKLLVGEVELRAAPQPRPGYVTFDVGAEICVVWWCEQCRQWMPLPGRSLPPWAANEVAQLTQRVP